MAKAGAVAAIAPHFWPDQPRANLPPSKANDDARPDISQGRQATADRKVFTDSVTSLPDQGPALHGLMVNAAQPEHSGETMRLLFSIAMPTASCMVNLATPASLTKRLTILVKPDIWPPVFGDGKT
jgi:hypothetical protein